MKRFCSVLALSAMVCAVPVRSVFGEEKPGLAPAPAAPAADPTTPAAPKGKRTAEQVQTDLQQASQDLRGVLASPETMIDPAKRAEAAPKTIPALKKMLALFEELATIEPDQKKELNGARLEFLTILTVFGDKDSAAALQTQAKAEGAAGLEGKLAAQVADFWKNGKDEAAQNKVLDEVQKIAKANPKDDTVTMTLMKMANLGPATPAVADRAESIIVSELKGEKAVEAAVEINGKKKMKDSVGKPVELAGTTLDGKAFTTKDWKGKVILVDFWATWCGPCIRELPRVKKMYIDFHAKGLEILGVSCDTELEALQGFMAKNKDMAWPQLFDAKQNPKLEWSPLAKEWGISGIPTMFLIDKNGILHSVTARENFEEAIPKLLEAK